MKKRVVIALSIIVSSVLFFSCGIFDFSDKFTPPTWIQGTWSDTSDMIIYTFESSNVIQTISTSESDSESDLPIDLSLVLFSATVTEISNDSLYSFTVDQSGLITSYWFEKTSDTTLDYSVTIEDSTYSLLELVKHAE